MSTIKSWSYSRLLDFEACRARAKMKHIDRIPEEKSDAADRGTAIHQMAEDFVVGKLKKLPVELFKFEAEFISLRQQYIEGNVSLEGEWGFTPDWEVTDYKKAFGRVKCDSVVFKDNGKHAIVIDYKTGKKWGNEVKHGEQVQLYAIATFARYPNVQTVEVELWYLDLDDLTPGTYTRDEGMRYAVGFDKRIKIMTSATKFPANANIFSCKWCPYGPAKGGQCKEGVLPGDNAISTYRRRFG